MDTPAAIQRGVAALRAGRPEEAVAALAAAWSDPELAAAADLSDIRARVGSLYAAALLELGRPREADVPCREALRLLRRLGDRAGLDEVRRLQDRVVKALAHDAEATQRAAEQARVAATPLDALLDGLTDDAERAAAMVRKAGALLDVGQPDAAAPLARRGLAHARDAGSTTWEVMARVALARSCPDEALDQLVAAHAAATGAGEFNLVSTVAHAARLVGVELPAEPFAGTPTGALP